MFFPFEMRIGEHDFQRGVARLLDNIDIADDVGQTKIGHSALARAVKLAWPAQVAPAHVHLVATGKDAAVFAACEELAADLHGQGVEVLYDDRFKVSPGVKFADAELLGIPVLVVVGRGLADGVIEVRLRRPADAGLAAGERPPAEQVPVADAAAHIAALVADLLER